MDLPDLHDWTGALESRDDPDVGVVQERLGLRAGSWRRGIAVR
jgi:hypothetical protein